VTGIGRGSNRIDVQTAKKQGFPAPIKVHSVCAEYRVSGVSSLSYYDCYDTLEMRQDKRCAMISPCQVAGYWSLHLLDFDWLKLYGSSAGFDPYRWATDKQFDR